MKLICSFVLTAAATHCAGCVCSSDLQPQTVRQLLQSVHAGIPGVFRLHARVVR